jgi:hypothetical protein
MPEYVTDTPALIWHLTRDAHLSPAARQAFVEADEGASFSSTSASDKHRGLASERSREAQHPLHDHFRLGLHHSRAKDIHNGYQIRPRRFYIRCRGVGVVIHLGVNTRIICTA